MEEREELGFQERIYKYLHSEYAEKIIISAVSFFAGMVSARGLVFGRYAPFGVAAAASVPRSGLWAAIIGAFVGYLFPSPANVPARYAAALIALAAIRWSLSELKAINTHALFAPVTTFLPLLLTGATVVVINGSVTASAAMYVAESFLGAGSAYFLTRTFGILTSRGRSGGYDTTDSASLIVSVCICVLSLSGMTIGGISIGRILTVLMVIYCARVGGLTAGAVSGVAAGAIQGLSLSGLSHLSGAYGLGGLMAGVFAPMGKITTAVAFIISHGVASLQIGNNEMVFIGAIEVASATILYMALPKSRWISELFSVRKETLSGGALRSNVVMRLKYASEALLGVSDAVEEVSKKLSAISAPDMRGVYDSSAEKICAGCGKSAVCWRKYKNDTIGGFSHLTKPLKEKGRVDNSDFSKEFLDRCGRSGEMREEINRNYAKYLTRETAELKAGQIREVVESHFRTTAGVLDELADEFSLYEHFDDEAAQRIAIVLRENGIEPLEVCCRVNRYDRMTVEAEISRERQKRLNRGTFTKEISAACGRLFSPPCVSTSGDSCRLQMSERTRFEVLRGFSQHNANNGSFCGDCASVFYDGSGRLVGIISDGMGTGGKAAVDGAMAAAMAENLLKAGIGFDSMLKTVNSALIAKSGDESIATLDIVSIDLFTGMAEFRKAGAAGTILRRKSKTEYIETSSIPVGIMPDAAFAFARRELESGDIIVMISDGVIATGSEWLIDFVANFDVEDDLNLMAEQLVTIARKGRSDGHEDDVSALILMLE